MPNYLLSSVKTSRTRKLKVVVIPCLWQYFWSNSTFRGFNQHSLKSLLGKVLYILSSRQNLKPLPKGVTTINCHKNKWKAIRQPCDNAVNCWLECRPVSRQGIKIGEKAWGNKISRERDTLKCIKTTNVFYFWKGRKCSGRLCTPAPLWACLNGFKECYLARLVLSDFNKSKAKSTI